MRAINFARNLFGMDGRLDSLPSSRHHLSMSVGNAGVGAAAGGSVGSEGGVSDVGMGREWQGVESRSYVTEDDDEDSVLGFDGQYGDEDGMVGCSGVVDGVGEVGEVEVKIEEQDEVGDAMQEMPDGDDSGMIAETDLTGYANSAASMREKKRPTPINATLPIHDFTDTGTLCSQIEDDAGEPGSEELEEKQLVLQRPGDDDDDEYVESLGEDIHEKEVDFMAYQHDSIEIDDGLAKGREQPRWRLIVKLKYGGYNAMSFNEGRLNDRKEQSQVGISYGSEDNLQIERISDHNNIRQQSPQIYSSVQNSPPRHGYHLPGSQELVLGKRKAVKELEDQGEDYASKNDGEEEESSDDEALMDRTRRLRSDKSTFVHNSGNKSAPSNPNTSNHISSPTTAMSTTQLPSPEPINWKLPTHAIYTSPPDPQTGNPTLKITLPNSIRETLLLSADHAQNETCLFHKIFLPAQMALSTPDPEPNTAILNFHNIAVMVLDTYHAHMTGDVLVRPGPNAPFADHAAFANSRDEGYAKTKDARDVDETEIFFAVVDRWRAGLEEPKKKAYEMIRGPQEFIETALDVIYFVKENGLIVERGEGEAKERKEGSDKGVKRGPKGGKDGKGKTGSGFKTKTGTKRNLKAVANELMGRKKQKTRK